MPRDLLDDPRFPQWVRRPRMFEVATLGLIITATVTGATAELLLKPSMGAVMGPLVAAGAALLGIRFPRAGVLMLAAAAPLAAVLGHEPLLTWTITVFGVFLLTFRGVPAWQTGLLVGASNFVSVTWFEDIGLLNPVAFVALTLTMLAAALGSAIRSQIRYFRASEQRALDALATRDVEANRRVAEERLRIARDLHDVVGHEVAVVGMQLGIAEVAMKGADDQARAALSSARAGVQSILRETQRILDLLRPTGEPENLKPAPEASNIVDLIEALRAAGMRIHADLAPDALAASGAAGVTAYRIAQEALTNAQRHGDGTAMVVLRLDGSGLHLRISNPLRATPSGSQGSGYGLVGMRERAQSAGGQVDAAPRGGEFVVDAVLPRGEGGQR